MQGFPCFWLNVDAKIEVSCMNESLFNNNNNNTGIYNIVWEII